MKKIECKYMDIFISKDLFEGLMMDYASNEDDIVYNLEQRVEFVINNEELFEKYIKAFSRFEARGRVAALYAEEDCTVRGEPAFLDGKRLKRVQGWIDKNDVEYGCLIILWHGSAHGPNDVKSDRSLVLTEDGASFRMYSPMAKEVIDAYTIDYHLKQLRKRVKANPNFS